MFQSLVYRLRIEIALVLPREQEDTEQNSRIERRMIRQCSVATGRRDADGHCAGQRGRADSQSRDRTEETQLLRTGRVLMDRLVSNRKRTETGEGGSVAEKKGNNSVTCWRHVIGSSCELGFIQRRTIGKIARFWYLTSTPSSSIQLLLLAK